MSQTVIKVKNLSVIRNHNTVLQNINLEIYQSEILGIIGPNSAGKSTLLKTILGYQKKCEGSIEILSKNIAQWNKNELAKNIAYLAQESVVHWPLSVEHIIALGRIPHQGQHFGLTNSSNQADTDLINQVMHYTDTHKLAKRIGTQLSGGELARVLLARALTVDAPILLADEPVSNLDPYFQLQILNLLQKKTQQGLSLVIVLHDLVLASRYCDRLALIHEGKLVALGKPNEVLTDEIIKQYYQVNSCTMKIDNTKFTIPWSIEN